MFEIGFPELVLIAVVGLLVIGPERLPEALRTLGLWVGRMRRAFTNVRAEIEREIGMDEVRRQLHNEAVMEEMKRIERDVRASVDGSAARRDANASDANVGDTERPRPERPEGTEPLTGTAAPSGSEPSAPASGAHPEAVSEEPETAARRGTDPQHG